jgi:two-component system, chemotaxis family, protein-glutamate methylesterase/glutaminase
MSQVIRTLIVEDSAFARKAIKEMLSRSPYIEVVGAAHDGLEALELVEELQPDVVTCDLMMPRLNGPGFVRRQMARRPTPILILSVADENAAVALEALEAGAVDFVRKPTALANDALFKVREELIEKIKAAASAHSESLQPKAPAAPVTLPPPRPSRVEVVVLGISTGGPQALRALLPQFPRDFPVPMAVVLHMPLGFTALYAAKLNELSALEVKEAAEGDLMRPGRCLLAPAGKHLLLHRQSNHSVLARLSAKPLEVLHRPSVDVLFRSAADTYADRVLGVVMTGMGSDGKEGAAWIKAQGGTIVTETEESCVIYGMPRVVVEAGLSDAAFPLGQMAQAIIERL